MLLHCNKIQASIICFEYQLHCSKIHNYSHWILNSHFEKSDFEEAIKVGHTPNRRSTRKRLIFVALCNDLIDYFIVCFEHQCMHFKKQLQLLRQQSLYEEHSFQHYLQHYSETVRTTEIQSCLQVHRQVCCDKMSSVAVKSYKY